MPKNLPDPEEMKMDGVERPCCQPAVKEYLDKYAELRRAGNKMEGYRVVSATLLQHGFKVSPWQVGWHVREHVG